MFRKEDNSEQFPKKRNMSKCEAEDRKLCLFVISFFLTSALNMSIKTIFPIPERLWGMISAFFMMLLGLVMVIALPIILNRGWKKFLLTEGVFVFLFVCSFLAGNASVSLLLRSGFWAIAVGIPLAFAVYVLQDKGLLLKMLYKSSYIQCIPLWLTLYYMREAGTYSMSASYSLVLPTLVFLQSFFERHRVRDLIVSVISALLILFFGARGPLFCIAFYVLLQMIFMKNGNMKKILWGALFSVIVTFFLFYSWIIKGVEIILVKYDISSYVLRNLISGSFFVSGGRDTLRAYYMERIWEKPFSGWGLMGGWTGSGSGPHNMLLEYILAFGIIVGAIVCLFAVLLLVKTFLLQKSEHRELTFIFVSYCVVLFLVAGNWLEKPEWFIFVALCVSAKSTKRMKWI